MRGGSSVGSAGGSVGGGTGSSTSTGACGGACGCSSSSRSASFGVGILSLGDISAGLASRLQQSGVVGLVFLCDLEGVCVATFDIVVRSPGEGAALARGSNGLDILQVT